MKTSLAIVTSAFGSAALLVACGARTDLLFGERPTPEPVTVDSGIDAYVPSDAGIDARDASDAHVDADAHADADADAFPPPPPVSICTDASAPLIYAVTLQNTLLAFDPSSNAFSVLGQSGCKAINYQPFSMAVDHTGTAFIEYQLMAGGGDNPLYKVSLATRACTPVQLLGRTTDFTTFGMGFSVDEAGVTETMYLSGNAAGYLGAVNEKTLVVKPVGFMVPTTLQAELSGTADGRLYAFSGSGTSGSSVIEEVDKHTALVTNTYSLPGVVPGQGWAFAYWGGDFYIFTAPTGAGSVVTRFRPSDNSIVDIANYSEIIVGAGASTCAPQ